MEIEAPEQQQKQDRHRTRWTASLDKIFADLVVEQIHLGNRPNNVFDKNSWHHIRNEFNKQTNLNFNNNQLRKHLDVLRTRYYTLKSAFDTNDDSCFIGFDLWEDIAGQPKPETNKIKECPIYEQLCTIFADSGADGKYAQSSHYEEVEKSTEGTNVKSKGIQGNETLNRKRKRGVESNKGEDNNISEAMGKAMMEMVESTKLRVIKTLSNEKFTISECIKVLDEIEGVDESVYYESLDLFEDGKLREVFLSLKSNEIRLKWLKGKCLIVV